VIRTSIGNDLASYLTAEASGCMGWSVLLGRRTAGRWTGFARGWDPDGVVEARAASRSRL